MMASQRSRTARGNGDAPDNQRQTVRGSRVRTSRAKPLTDLPEALIAAEINSRSVTARSCQDPSGAIVSDSASASEHLGWLKRPSRQHVAAFAVQVHWGRLSDWVGLVANPCAFGSLRRDRHFVLPCWRGGIATAHTSNMAPTSDARQRRKTETYVTKEALNG